MPETRTSRARLLAILGAALAAACFILPVARVLNARAVDEAVQPLGTFREEWAHVPVPIPATTFLTTSGGYQRLELRMRTGNPQRLISHSEIRLLVATYETTPVADAARLEFAGTTCAFVMARGAIFRNNGYLTLDRREDCVPLQGNPTGEVILSLRFASIGRGAIWTCVPPAGVAVAEDDLIVADPRLWQTRANPIVRGLLADTFTSRRIARSHMLAYAWSGIERDRWLWIVLATAAALLAAGLFLLLHAGPGRARRAAAGAFALSLGLGLVYLAITPPFEAADEPSHFLGYTQILRRPELVTDAVQISNRGHLDRLRFNPGERLRPSDIGQPLKASWTTGIGLIDVDSRGMAAGFLWRALGLVLRSPSAAVHVAGLRLVHCLLFAGALALAAWLAWRAGTPSPALVLAPFLLAPTLPFFGTTMSNYALLTAAYVLVGSAAACLIAGQQPSRATMAALAGGTALALMSSRSAIPLLPVVAASGVLFAFRRARNGDSAGPPDRRVRAVALVLAIALTLLIAWAVATPPRFSLALEGGTRPALWPYIGSIFAGLLPRLAHPDTLMTLTYWQGFGWLDTFPSLSLAAWLSTATWTAFAGTWWWLWRRGRTREILGALLVSAALAAALVLYGVAAYRVPVNLHGRYLVGWYAVWLPLAWLGLAGVASTLTPARRHAVQWAAFAGCLAIHGYCAASLVARYF